MLAAQQVRSELNIRVWVTSTTYITDMVFRLWLRTAQARGLDNDYLLRQREAIIKGLHTWLVMQQLVSAWLEIYDPQTRKMYERWDLTFSYETGEAPVGRHESENYADLISKLATKLEQVPPGMAYRVVANLNRGSDKAPGWSQTRPGSARHLPRRQAARAASSPTISMVLELRGETDADVAIEESLTALQALLIDCELPSLDLETRVLLHSEVLPWYRAKTLVALAVLVEDIEIVLGAVDRNGASYRETMGKTRAALRRLQSKAVPGSGRGTRYVMAVELREQAGSRPGWVRDRSKYNQVIVVGDLDRDALHRAARYRRQAPRRDPAGRTGGHGSPKIDPRLPHDPQQEAKGEGQDEHGHERETKPRP